MKLLSRWAQHHQWTARLLIILVFYPILNLSGWILGDLLQSEGIVLGSVWSYLLCGSILALFFIYPNKKDRRYRNWRFRKTLDCLLILCTFGCILFSGNRYAAGSSLELFTQGHATTQAPALDQARMEQPPKKKGLRKLVRELRRKYRDADNGSKVALTILVVVIFVFAVFGLAALSCSIACSGAEGLAYIVFFLGLGGLIFGLVKLLQRIKRGKKKPPAEQQS
jgi:hypothetical protein